MIKECRLNLGVVPGKGWGVGGGGLKEPVCVQIVFISAKLRFQAVVVTFSYVFLVISVNVKTLYIVI